MSRIRAIAIAVVVTALCVAAMASPAGAAGAARGGVVVSRLGDRDNFGYGPGAPPRCAFYDNREPEDLGVFDYELQNGDGNDSWTHEITVPGTPTEVRLSVWESFADSTVSTIAIDGHVFTFAAPPFQTCDTLTEYGIQRTFVLTGADALVASDGRVVVKLHENGDDITLDGATLSVRYTT